MDIVDKYCSFIFGYFGYNNIIRLNLMAFNYISSYVINRNFSFIDLAYQEFCDFD